MADKGINDSHKSQSNKFKEAARDLEADTDEKHWEERLKRIAKAKDVPVPRREGPLRSKKTAGRNEEGNDGTHN